MESPQARPQRSPLPLHRLRLAGECAIWIVALPLALHHWRLDFAHRFLPGLLLVAAGCLLVLLCDPGFDRRQLWHFRPARNDLPRTLRRFAVLAVPLILWTILVEPERFLGFPRNNLPAWLFVMLFYPLLSVYPQELIFRTFFFHRYRPLFGDSLWLVAASALAFGMAHLFFANWIAVLLSTAGGVLFALNYRRTRSTLSVTIEHGIWGDFLFTVGLGWYFYGGSVRAAVMD